MQLIIYKKDNKGFELRMFNLWSGLCYGYSEKGKVCI